MVWGAIPTPDGAQKSLDSLKGIDKAFNLYRDLLQPYHETEREEAIVRAEKIMSKEKGKAYKVKRIGQAGVRSGGGGGQGLTARVKRGMLRVRRQREEKRRRDREPT